MRNKLLALIICGLPLIAAEKNRDWQAGQVVGSKALTDSRDHAIATGDKTYLVRGSFGGSEDALAIGATVRFAVEDKNMFLSIAGKEFKLYVLGVRAAGAKPAQPALPAAAAATPPAPKAPQPPVPPSPQPSVAAAKPPATVAESTAPAEPPLDNDAVVKMLLGGLKEDTVVRVIEARPGKYTLTADALAALKAAGVSQTVVAAMSAKMKTPGR